MADEETPETESEDRPGTVTHYDSSGIRSGEIDLPAAVFGQTPHNAVMHQAYVRQLANARY